MTHPLDSGVRIKCLGLMLFRIPPRSVAAWKVESGSGSEGEPSTLSKGIQQRRQHMRLLYATFCEYALSIYIHLSGCPCVNMSTRIHALT